MANIYKLTQSVHDGYDTYKGAVVVAESEEAARHIHPFPTEKEWWDDDHDVECWAKPEDISVELIGTATPGLKPNTVVISDFRAG